MHYKALIARYESWQIQGIQEEKTHTITWTGEMSTGIIVNVNSFEAGFHV